MRKHVESFYETPSFSEDAFNRDYMPQHFLSQLLYLPILVAETKSLLQLSWMILFECIPFPSQDYCNVCFYIGFGKLFDLGREF